MSLKILFLGTSGAIPTTKRSLPAIMLQRENEVLLFDCGEGVQRQMFQARRGFSKKMKVFITHLHGDHVLGLPGLMQTMALLDRSKELEIYGPVGIKVLLECIRETLQFGLTYPVRIHEIVDEGLVCSENEYTVEAKRSNHIDSSFAYAYVEQSRPGKFYPQKAKRLGVPKGPQWSELQKGQNITLPNRQTVKSEQVTGPRRSGRKIVYTGDTRPFNGLIEFATHADVLIHDATLDDELSERAMEDGHSTPSQAALTARKAHVKQLVLTHIGARYSKPEILLLQAKKTFRKTIIAEDFMNIDVPLIQR